MTTIELTITSVDWPAIVDAVDQHNERFRLTRNGRVVAEIGPPSRRVVSVKDLLQAMKSGPRLGSEESAAFADELDEARQQVNDLGVASPWDS